MTPTEWFLMGGIWMWPILLLVLAGGALTLVALIFLPMSGGRVQGFRRGIGVALVAVAVLCLAAGGVGHIHSKSRINAFVEERNINDPEFFAVANREARVPLEASVVPAIVFGGVGLLAARRKTHE